MAAALLAGVLTLYAILRVWLSVFWAPAPHPSSAPPPAVPRAIGAVLVILTMGTVALGLGGEALWSLADTAAGQLLDRDAYIEAVLGDRAP